MIDDKVVANRNFKQLLKNNIQFEIPFFQRGYAWEKKHWKQLFDDIQERIISDIDFGNPLDEVEHFFGPIVVLERLTSDFELKKFQVIDGQQRISTIYILIAIIRNILMEKIHDSQQANEYVAQLNNYLINNIDDTDDYKKLKLFSSKGDRLPTYYLVFSNTNPNSPYLLADQQIYNPKNNKIDGLKKWAEKNIRKEFDSVPKLWQLSEILLESLKIVWIPLDENKDDPQAIFESLNDRGMPLTAGELICNYLFKPLIAANENFEEMHNKLWLATAKGIDTNGNFEDYLRNYLTIGEKKVIGKGRRIYVFFKMKNKRLSASEAKFFLEHINKFYPSYNSIVNPIQHPHSNSEINDLLIKLSSTRMDACNPFLLSLLKSLEIDAIDENQCIEMIHEIFILVTRRKYCEMPTQKYDLIFPNLLSKIINEPDKAKAIQDIFIKENYFVSNQEIKEAIINRPLYRPRDLSFTRMILREIDKSMQSYGQLPDYTTLNTIEHVLPQTLTDSWKTYLGKDSEDIDLNRYVNTIGNLCLLSQPANSHAGQDPFEDKKKDYTDVSALTRDIKSRNIHWDINGIKDRSKYLSEKALQIWAWKE
jgi:uncharacterized protein with ParB-like and HNH nuclease domain